MLWLQRLTRLTSRALLAVKIAERRCASAQMTVMATSIELQAVAITYSHQCMLGVRYVLRGHERSMSVRPATQAA